MFNGTRYTIPAKVIIEELLPNFEKQTLKN
jgi:hypothetical protein